tara:strand:- start:983 stop:2149 length:1167 start_codon:yes stop_codon:yes gene_type:complete
VNSLKDATSQRLLRALEDSPFDGLILANPSNVAYATGYRSVASVIAPGIRMLACITNERQLLIAPAADAAAAFDSGISEDDFVPYGKFFFESSDNQHAAAAMSDLHADMESALTEALARSGVSGAIGVDNLVPERTSVLLEEQSEISAMADANDWILGIRSIKTAPEIDLLLSAIKCTETGLDRALEAAYPGITERELASFIAQSMVEAAAEPRFLVVTTGPRSALSDARATDRAWEPGELLRFDVGCTYNGYWSDIGRTAVLGEASSEQERCYEAILAGEQAQLDRARPGMTTGELFDIAVEAVEENGIKPYRRTHCGHAIGSEVYEWPIVAPNSTAELEPGMVFCVETPYYCLGWGGMMVEDAILITSEGNSKLTSLDRSLWVVPA